MASCNSSGEPQAIAAQFGIGDEEVNVPAEQLIVITILTLLMMNLLQEKPMFLSYRIPLDP